MDLLLINPGKVRYDYVTEHLGIASLKSYVISQGFSADTLDMAIEELSVQDGIRRIHEINPKMLGISLLDDSKEKGISLIKSLRKTGYSGNIVVGGYFPTFSSQEILRDFPEIDFVVRGEGEFTLAELMQKLIGKQDMPLESILGLSYRVDGQIRENPARPLIHDLDQLPPIDRKYAGMVLKKGSQLRIYGTRGCWGQCTFCDIIGFYRSSMGKVWRYRSTKSLVDEIEQLVNTYNTGYFVFNDDQFLLKGKKALERAKGFADELKSRNLNIEFELMCRADTVDRQAFSILKSVGLKRVFLGLESFDDKHLQIFHKRISVRQNLKALITLYQLKIDVIASVILVNAYTTLKDLVKQFIILYELKGRYFNSSNCQISINNKLEVYRGSAVYREYKRQNLLTRDHYWEGYDFKMKFWTGVRMRLFDFEVKLSRFILKPGEILGNFYARIKWQFNQVKTAFSINKLKWSHHVINK